MESLSEAQQKWDLMHTFSYAYICQPPEEYWRDEEYMLHRDILLSQIGGNVHKTDWKVIFSRYKDHLPIRLAYKDAKEYYDAICSCNTTSAYEAIRAYAENVAFQRSVIRAHPDADVSYVAMYLKKGDGYSNPYATVNKNVAKQKKK